MLAWSAGPKSFDGPWAPHWYNSVHESTGFAGAEGPLPPVTDVHYALFEDALARYAKLNALKTKF